MTTQSLRRKGISLGKRHVLITVLCLFAIFQAGLRDMNNLPVENDTPNYYESYIRISQTPWSEIFNTFDIYNDDYGERDRGFPVFVKLTQTVYNDFTFFMFLVAIIFIIPLGSLVEKYVKSYLGIILSFATYFALYSIIPNSFMRQATVLGIYMFSLRYILERNWKKYFGIMLLAFTVHSSSLIALPLYFVPVIKNLKKWLLIALVISPVLLYLSDILVTRIMSGTVYAVFLSADNYGVTSVIMLVEFVSVLALLLFDKIENTPYAKLLLGGMVGALVLLPFVRIGGTIMRISYYYNIFIIPLIPVIINNAFVKQKNAFPRNVVYLLSIFFFAYMYFR